jgi:hypothetical protein
MMTEPKIRKIAADALKRLGSKDVTPDSVPLELVANIYGSFNRSGNVNFILTRELSDRESEAFIGSLIGLLAMFSPEEVYRKNAGKQLKAAAAQAASL